jgi:16S rRNA (cytosine1407-C5)-methyltransferase
MDIQCMNHSINLKFQEYYSRLYGSRWKTLKKCLLQERPLYEFSQGLKTPYFLDYASVLAALSLKLPLQNESTVLDACAAPGGKTLVITSVLPAGGLLLSNELSTDRRRRLSDVLDKHLDSDKRKQVRVCGFDAASAGRRKSEHNRFQAILLDAPCSSEAHVLKDPRALAAWTPARPQFLAQRQWALLSSAFLMLSKGGSLVYSTCAITEIENDGVMRRLIKKYGEQVQLDLPDFTEGEKTEYGRIILPDTDGCGPLYTARLKKSQA